MKKIKYLLVALALFLTFDSVHAQTINITAPSATTVLKNGQTYRIEWTNNLNGQTFYLCNVELVYPSGSVTDRIYFPTNCSDQPFTRNYVDWTVNGGNLSLAGDPTKYKIRIQGRVGDRWNGAYLDVSSPNFTITEIPNLEIVTTNSYTFPTKFKDDIAHDYYLKTIGFRYDFLLTAKNSDIWIPTAGRYYTMGSLLGHPSMVDMTDDPNAWNAMGDSSIGDYGFTYSRDLQQGDLGGKKFSILPKGESVVMSLNSILRYYTNTYKEPSFMGVPIYSRSPHFKWMTPQTSNLPSSGGYYFGTTLRSPTITLSADTLFNEISINPAVSASKDTLRTITNQNLSSSEKRNLVINGVVRTGGFQYNDVTKQITFIPSQIVPALPNLNDGSVAYELFVRTPASQSNWLPLLVVNPGVKVDKPNGGETYVSGSNIPVQWQTYGLSSGTTLGIYIKNEKTGGITYLRKGAINDGNELISTVGIPVGQYKIGIRATVNNVVVFDESDTVFTIDSVMSSGPNVTFVSANTDVNAGTSSNDDLGTFRIRFKVRAVGNDIYIPSHRNLSGYNWVVDRQGVVVNNGISATITMLDSSPASNLTPFGNYVIREGEERTLELVASVQLPTAGTAGQYSLRLGGMRWDVVDTTSFSKVVNVDSGIFRTSYQVLNQINKETQVANIQEAIRVLLEQLKNQL